jgi:hypothetical protein
MCHPTDPPDFPELPDGAVVAIENFLEDFYIRFQNHYFAQMFRYYNGRPVETNPDYPQMTLPLSDPPF